MTLHDIDYYSEHALNEREVAMTAQREKARRIREALERQYDAMFSPKPIRSTLSIVAPTSKRLVECLQGHKETSSESND